VDCERSKRSRSIPPSVDAPEDRAPLSRCLFSSDDGDWPVELGRNESIQLCSNAVGQHCGMTLCCDVATRAVPRVLERLPLSGSAVLSPGAQALRCAHSFGDQKVVAIPEAPHRTRRFGVSRTPRWCNARARVLAPCALRVESRWSGVYACARLVLLHDVLRVERVWHGDCSSRGPASLGRTEGGT